MHRAKVSFPSIERSCTVHSFLRIILNTCRGHFSQRARKSARTWCANLWAPAGEKQFWADERTKQGLRRTARVGLVGNLDGSRQVRRISTTAESRTGIDEPPKPEISRREFRLASY